MFHDWAAAALGCRFLLAADMKPSSFHPAVLILLWVVLALLVQRVQGIGLLLLGILCVVLAMVVNYARWSGLLRRTRWIALSLLLVYAYATPGTALWGALGIWSPTREGMTDGMLQLTRLLCVLAGLAALLTWLTQEQFIGGLYDLAGPLRWLGFPRERFAVRLALTLRYAEADMRSAGESWRATLARAMQTGGEGENHIQLLRQHMCWQDVAVLLLAAVLLAKSWQ